MEINSKRDLARFIIDKIMTIHEIVFSLSSSVFAEILLTNMDFSGSQTCVRYVNDLFAL